MNMGIAVGILFLHCVSENPTFILPVALSNLNQLSKFLHCCKAYEICYKNAGYYPLTLGTLSHYVGKLEIQIFSRYSADTTEIANKLYLSVPILIPLRVLLCILSVFMCFLINILSLSLNNMLIADKHCCDVCCNEFQIDRKFAMSNKYNNSDMENFICNQYGENSLF